MSISTNNIQTSTKIADTTNQSKTVNFNLSGATTSTGITLGFNQTVNRNIAFPDKSGTVALTSNLPSIKTGTQPSISQTTTTLTTNIIFGSAFTSAPTVSASIKNYTHPERIINVSPSNATTTNFNANITVDNYEATTTQTVDTGFTATADNGGTSVYKVEGNPAIVYQDSVANELRFARNSARDGSGTWLITAVHSATTGRHPVLRVFGGYPVVAYFTSSTIVVRRSSTQTGSGTWSQISSIAITGIWLSMELVNGFPAISFFDARLTPFQRNPRFAINSASDATGTWTVYNVVPTNGVTSVGFNTSLNVLAGNPAITYYNQPTNAKYFVRATAANGSTWGTPFMFASGGGFNTSPLEIVAGLPAIAYIDNTNNVKFIRNNQATGLGTWSSPVTIDTCSTSTYYITMNIVDGNPAVTYQNSSNQLKYARNTAADGSGTWLISTVDSSSANIGRYSSMEIIDNNPHISYTDVTNSLTKFAKGTFTVQYDVDYIAAL